jgi:periplasmic protein TonB
MNQQAILQSNLLDIIFENRNKDYGAYKLRKSYQSRLSIAVLSTAGLALILSLFLLSDNSSVVFKPVHPGISIPDAKLSNLHRLVQPGNKKILKQHPAVKSIPEVEKPPLIVPTDNINSLPATPAEIQPSFTGANASGMNLASNADEVEEGGLDGNAAMIKTIPEPDKSIPVAVAETMPQYPGGIQALLSFLKKNIHSPGNIEEGEDVTVKIEFVVNYNGNLENFIVIKSGGAIFDNEVLRVLKKMPLWIPGKSKGKNVAVYYTVPVKFTSEF